MKKTFFYALIALFIACLFAIVIYRYLGIGIDLPEKAFKNYLIGEKAKTLAERKTAFNESLSAYLELEQKYNPDMGNGKLYYDIANAYYQLDKFPYAVLYYNKSLDLRPRDVNVKHNLELARKKLRLEDGDEESLISQLFYFHRVLSIPEKLQLLFVLSLIALICYSLYIWLQKKGVKLLGHAALFFSSMFFIILIYAHYFEPLEGVLLRASTLLRGPATYYSDVLDEPIKAGSKLRIIDIKNNGDWMKVETKKGDVGYVSYEEFRVI